MNWAIHDENQRMKVVIMVSRFGHCLNDLLYRVRIGALPIDIVAVISNHLDFQKLVVNHDIPFHYIRVNKDNKAEAEAQQLRIFEETGAELVVLARYMQVLSDDFCARLSGRIINIHHSFLPSFKGANPYRQAFRRGVKLIGATSHYVTAALDEGPIIEQDTIRVTHAQSPEDYISLGRDVESQVLARSIHAHIHRRVFLNADKTVVFRPRRAPTPRTRWADAARWIAAGASGETPGAGDAQNHHQRRRQHGRRDGLPSSQAARPRLMKGCSNCSCPTPAMPPRASPRYQKMNPIIMLNTET